MLLWLQLLQFYASPVNIYFRYHSAFQRVFFSTRSNFSVNTFFIKYLIEAEILRANYYIEKLVFTKIAKLSTNTNNEMYCTVNLNFTLDILYVLNKPRQCRNAGAFEKQEYFFRVVLSGYIITRFSRGNFGLNYHKIVAFQTCAVAILYHFFCENM